VFRATTTSADSGLAASPSSGFIEQFHRASYRRVVQIQADGLFPTALGLQMNAVVEMLPYEAFLHDFDETWIDFLQYH